MVCSLTYEQILYWLIAVIHTDTGKTIQASTRFDATDGGLNLDSRALEDYIKPMRGLVSPCKIKKLKRADIDACETVAEYAKLIHGALA